MIRFEGFVSVFVLHLRQRFQINFVRCFFRPSAKTALARSEHQTNFGLRKAVSTVGQKTIETIHVSVCDQICEKLEVEQNVHNEIGTSYLRQSFPINYFRCVLRPSDTALSNYFSLLQMLLFLPFMCNSCVSS